MEYHCLFVHWSLLSLLDDPIVHQDDQEMKNGHINVLLIEANPDDAQQIKIAMANAKEKITFKLEWVERFSAALEHLVENEIDVVLLDLFLPDSQGLDTFIKARKQAPSVPIVVLADLEH